MEYKITFEELEKGFEKWSKFAPNKGKTARGANNLIGLEYKISKFLDLIASVLVYNYETIMQIATSNIKTLTKLNREKYNLYLEKFEQFKNLNMENMTLLELVNIDFKKYAI